MKISYIVIAKNEGNIIGKCLRSIAEGMDADSEVICVDSDSSDNTLEKMLGWKQQLYNEKVYRISGEVNAAIARNVGIVKATGDIIFFIDGDVELDKAFLSAAIEELKNKSVGAVVGRLAEYQYRDGFKDVFNKLEDRNNIRAKVYRNILGGIFVTRRDVVKEVGMFDESLKYHEDTDYSLRISENHKIVGLPIMMGVHHTIPRAQKNRLKEWISDKYGVYIGAVFIRNITHWPGICELIKNEKGILSGILFYLLVFSMLMAIKIESALIITSIIIIIDIVRARSRNKNIVHMLYARYVMSLYFLLGLAYFRRASKNYLVNEVTDGG